MEDPSALKRAIKMRRMELEEIRFTMNGWISMGRKGMYLPKVCPGTIVINGEMAENNWVNCGEITLLIGVITPFMTRLGAHLVPYIYWIRWV